MSFFSLKSPAEKKLILQVVIAAILTSILGVFFHFVYDLSGQNTFAALFTPVNESTWEHLKLLFFPMLACLLILYPIAHRAPTDILFTPMGYFRGIAAGTLTGCASIVILYYFLTGLIGRNIDWLNIVIYFLGVIIGYLVFYGNATEEFTLITHDHITSEALSIALSVGILVLISILFFVFTFAPPECLLFLDPVTMSYGI